MVLPAEHLLDPSNRVLALPLGQFDCRPVSLRGGSGLPQGALYLRTPKLILASTPCDPPLFQEHIVKACKALRQDVLLQRTGLFPETLNPVRSEVVLNSIGGQIHLQDLSYFRALDGRLWLLPERAHGFVEITARGLVLTSAPPFADRDDRSDGLCRAATEIVRISRKGCR